MNQSIGQKTSLITQPENTSRIKTKRNKVRLHSVITFLFITIIIALLVFSIIGSFNQNKVVLPIKVAIPWFPNKTIVFQLGTSRIFQPLLYSGYDNRSLSNFRQVTERQVQWSVNPEGIVTVDMYGRVNAITVGKCSLSLKSKASSVSDQRQIEVISKSQKDNFNRRIISFKGQPAKAFDNLQKIVQRFEKGDALVNPKVPESVKYAIQHLGQNYPHSIINGQISWTIMNYANGNGNQYVMRVNNSMGQKQRDREQYFIGDRYLPDDGLSVVMIQKDDDNGLWVVGKSGNTTHISMLAMSYRQKAKLMNQQTEKYVIRHGLSSGAQWNGTQWIKQVSDNDGLWTSIYGAGQCMKYSVLKQKEMDQTPIKQARKSCLKSLKAVLLIANVAGREGKVMAKIRHLNNTRSGEQSYYSQQFLLKGKPNLRDTYVGLPSDGDSFYGVQAGKKSDDGNFYEGHYKYSMLPIKKEDWSVTGEPALTERTLDGFMSRTFALPQVDSIPYYDGLFFKRQDNNTHKVLSGASLLYDYTDDEYPNLELGNRPIPEILKEVLIVNGVQYDSKDLVYKGDTSTDEVIGHLFLYKISFDILSNQDQQEKGLKQLIRQTMKNFCQHLVNNGYSMVDATGQATQWSKLYKEVFSSDYSIQDCHLKAIQLLLSFKVAYYVTGETKWKQEYDLLAKDEKFMYAQLMGHMWDKYVWAFTRADDVDNGFLKFDYTLNPSKVQVQRRVLYQTHFSDEQEAYLAYYLIFQLQDDPSLLEKYRKGLNGFWHSISWSQNPLWYYIYQLSSPQKALQDSYGNDLREVASWQLSRHMIDTTGYQAYVKGSRPDVIFEGHISVNPFKVTGKRTSISDKALVNSTENYAIFKSFDPNNIYEVKVLPADERSIHKFNGATFDGIDQYHNKNNVQPSTTFTTPFWLGVYHNLLELD